MKFCTECASPLGWSVPPGDDRPRHVCAACGLVLYENPKVVTGCIVEVAGEVLLCRRAIEPSSGRWTFPAGFLELGESQAEGAKRETLEESGARVEVLDPHAYLDVPHISQCYAVFRGRLLERSEDFGHESSEVAMFPLPDVPWGELAFPVVSIALRLFVEDEARGRQQVHTGVLRWRGTGSRYDAAEYDLEPYRALEVRRRRD